MEKPSVVPVHKKGSKENLKKYSPISLLPICSKTFEHLIYSAMFGFFLVRMIDLSKAIRN